MAKRLKSVRAAKKPTPKGAGKQKMKLAPGETNGRLTRHINLLLDPCGAELGPTAYRGRDGFVNRFNTFFSVGPVGSSCSVFMYHPRLNRVYNRGVTLFNDVVGAIDWFGTFSSPGPGANYLAANADEVRTISSCVQAYYTGTELDRQGLVYRGVVPARALADAGNTVGTLSQLLQARERTPDYTMETKWVPGPGDENYQQPSAPNTDYDDTVVVMLFSGFAANKLIFNFRVVSNVEWLPAPAVGIMTPSPSSPDVPAGLERVRNALSTFGNWWLEAAHTARVAGNVARQVYSGARSVASIAAPRVPMLLTL